jgi:hypothetical protein
VRRLHARTMRRGTSVRLGDRLRDAERRLVGL